MDGLPIWEYFTDAVLRGPTIGAMLMSLAASLIGVIAFLRKQSLLGEALSHAAYPGIMLGVVVVATFDEGSEADFSLAVAVMVGAYLSAFLGMRCIRLLVDRFRIRPDSALCFVLSSFFGVGITLASQIQFTHSVLYKQSLSYLYGQAATMTDFHIVLYGLLSFVIIVIIALFYRQLQVMTFDQDYAASLGVKTKWLDSVIIALIVLAVVIGMRSVGVVLMSAMFIAPAVAARQFTNRLSLMLVLAGCVAMVSGFFGNYLSVQFGQVLAKEYPGLRLALPTGPMIVIVASMCSLLALLFAPERGLLLRYCRVGYFHFRCSIENVLKMMWRHGVDKAYRLREIAREQNMSKFRVWLILAVLRWRNRVVVDGKGYRLTRQGEKQAQQIVRLHRLWEVYLVDYLGMGAERVHRNAEEMEHIITPELEAELSLLLKNPKQDPHLQPIPPSNGSEK